jgi:hypothetical protein
MGNVMGLFHGSTMTYEVTAKSMRLFAEQVLPRFRAEVYDPWIKEHGLERVLTPKSAGAQAQAARRATAVA